MDRTHASTPTPEPAAEPAPPGLEVVLDGDNWGEGLLGESEPDHKGDIEHLMRQGAAEVDVVVQGDEGVDLEAVVAPHAGATPVLFSTSRAYLAAKHWNGDTLAGRLASPAATVPTALLHFPTLDAAEEFALSLRSAAVRTYFDYPNQLSAPGNVFVRGIGASASEHDLYALLSKYGQINDIKIVTKLALNRFAFAKFNSVTDAAAAINALNGTTPFPPAPLFLNPYLSKRERVHTHHHGDAVPTPNYRTVYLRRLPASVLTETINLLVRPFGHVVLTYTPPSTVPRQSTKACFVVFRSTRAALKAKIALDRATVEGHEVFAEIAQLRHYALYVLSPAIQAQLHDHPANDFQETNVYAKNIPLSVLDDQLRSVFEPYGDIVLAKVITRGGARNPHQSLGYGFVCFRTLLMAASAVLGLNRKVLGGNRLLLLFAQPNSHKHTRRHPPEPVPIPGSFPPALYMYTPPVGFYYPPMMGPGMPVYGYPVPPHPHEQP